jgi:adenylate cyclase
MPGCHHRVMREPDPEASPPPTDEAANERWRGVLAGDNPSSPLRRLRSIFRHLPSDPRCKLCYAPYAAPFGPIVGRMGFGRWEKNPSLCGSCLRTMERYQGGAEIELSMLFADLRGSTEIAARMSASAYSRLLNAFYAIAAHAVQAPGGHVDKYLGDGVLALFVPGFVGPDHAARAIDAARRIQAETADASSLPESERPLPVGVGVHTGTAYVGVLGQAGDLTDFTALGDAVNITERLSSDAAAREILISDSALVASGLASGDLQRRELRLKGVAEPVVAWSQTDTSVVSPR